MATITADEALAELKARGVDPANPPAFPDTSTVNPQDALIELQRRGVAIPHANSLPSYASPAQQTQYPISSMVSKGLGVAAEALQSPFQAVGEPIRRAVTAAQGQYPGPYRAPTIVQRMASLFPNAPEAIQTKEQAPDMFSAIVNPAMAGYKGIAATAQNALRGPAQALQAGKEAVNQPSGLPESVLSTVAALGSGEMGNIPFTAAIKPFTVIAKLLETGEVGGIPGSGALLKKITETHPLPLGLENLTAEANPEVLKAAKDSNVPLTPAGITGSPTLSTIEGFLRKLPFSSNVMQERFGQQLEALGKVREPIVQATKPPTDLGLDIQQGISAASNANMGKAKALYSNAENTLPQGAQIPISNVKSVATNLAASQAKLPPGARAGGAGQILADLADKKSPAAMDYQTLQALRSELNSRIAASNAALKSASPNASFQASPESRFYGKLKDAIDQDLNAFSDKTGGAFKSAFSEANNTYKTYKQTYANDKFVQSILNEQNPENVVNKVIKAAKDNPRALGTLKLNLPSDTLNDLQTYFIKDMTEKDPNVFSPTHFVSQYNSIGEDKLKDILGPEKLAQIRPLYLLSKASVTAEKLGSSAVGPSGGGMASTAGMMAPLMMAIKGMAEGHPIKGALGAAGILGAEMEGLPMIAKAYLSGPSTKLLSRQTHITPSFTNADQILEPVGKASIPIKDLVEKLKQKFNQPKGGK